MLRKAYAPPTVQTNPAPGVRRRRTDNGQICHVAGCGQHHTFSVSLMIVVVGIDRVPSRRDAPSLVARARSVGHDVRLAGG